MDGLKPGQRKIVFACFKRNLRADIKVAQLAGYVAEHSAYHHGETSLQGTIVGLAQNFVGSNNVNLLVPQGGCRRSRGLEGFVQSRGCARGRQGPWLSASSDRKYSQESCREELRTQKCE